MIALIKKIIFYINYLRTAPVYLGYLLSAQRKQIKMDLDRWRDVTSDRCAPEKSDFALMNRLLMSQEAFRNLIQLRLKKPPFTAVGVLFWAIARMLWRPLDSLYFGTYEIGGGLFIQHGYSTSVDAERIGENCWINQQVTIGYSGSEHPVLEDWVTVHCGAKVLGGVTMHRNSTAGANAVVVKDVPENAVVGGVPAKIIKMKE